MKKIMPSYIVNKKAIALIIFSIFSVSTSAIAAVSKAELNPSAPTSYTVKKGDTLWSVSGIFLKKPWLWPQIWGMNKTSIRNPNLIYPGDILNLKEGENGFSLYTGASAEREPGTIYLSPQIREESVAGPIRSISASAIAPFIDRPLVLDNEKMLTGPTIISAQEGRINLGSGSFAYVDNVTEAAGTKFWIYRPGSVLVDPQSGSSLGLEINNLGTAKIVRQPDSGRPAKILITSATREVSIGDRLVPVVNSQTPDFIPHAPGINMQGAIISVHGHLNESASQTGLGGADVEAGAMSVVVLNKGLDDGIEEGHVFSLFSTAKDIVPRNSLGYRNGDKIDPKAVSMPEEENGSVMVFKVYQKVAYAIILNGELPVRAGDHFSQP